MKYILNNILFLFCPVLAFTQFYIKGEVKDEAGNLLQNVNIVLQSTAYVYHSGTEGAFGIISNYKADTLIFSFEGYQKQKLPVNSDGYVEVKLKKTAFLNYKGKKLSSLTQNLTREDQEEWFTGDETYASSIENQFIRTSSYPSTGMTLNVDRASYSNIRRFLNMNSTVPPDAVRIEEMLNYFNFNYFEPAANKDFEIKTTLTNCPWKKENQLLFAQINSKKISPEKLPASNLVFLIDVSGSMDMPNRLPLLKNGFKSLVNNLRSVDSVSIVVYGGTTGIVLPTTGGDNKAKIFTTIDSLHASGLTPGESGIKLAYSMAKNHFIHGGNNRIILATDGDFNVGLKSEDELEKMVYRERESGIYLTCLGMGMGNYKDSKIQLLAERGNGNFAYLDSYAEAEKVLLKEFTQTLYTVADDAYLNVLFNPAFVKEYRLLGFDNKVGAIKDKEASIEGGEIGPSYSILVAFEIVPVLENYPSDSLLRLISFKLQYKNPGSLKILQVHEEPVVGLQTFDQVDRSYQFATAVILFGSILKKSKFTKESSFSKVLEIANGSVDKNSFSQKEFLSLVEKAKVIYNKKRKKEND